MKKLKSVKINPLRELDHNRDIQSTPKGNYDMTDLSEEQTNKIFKELNKFLKKHKDKGILVTKSVEDKQYLSLNINSGANKKNILSFPEPNPVILNYRTANQNLEKALKLKNKLLQVKTNRTGEQFDLFSEYYQSSSVGVVFLTATVEAFMNQWIRFQGVVKIDGIDKNKEELEYLDFNTKITKMLPQITGKNYQRSFPKKYNIISTCNSIRDDIIHLKMEINPNKTIYENIYKRLFDLPIKEASDIVFEFVNFHYPNLFIEEPEIEEKERKPQRTMWKTAIASIRRLLRLH